MQLQESSIQLNAKFEEDIAELEAMLKDKSAYILRLQVVKRVILP